MNLLGRIQAKLKPKPVMPRPILDSEQSKILRNAVKVTSQPVPLPKPRSRGRVIKQTHSVEFNPDPTFKGGRIVKVMPRKLQKIKAAQENVENDANQVQPTLEDLED